MTLDTRLEDNLMELSRNIRAGITPVCLFDQTIKSQNNQVGSQWICCRDSN